jgi:hypothetical protein
VWLTGEINVFVLSRKSAGGLRGLNDVDYDWYGIYSLRHYNHDRLQSLGTDSALVLVTLTVFLLGASSDLLVCVFSSAPCSALC